MENLSRHKRDIESQASLVEIERNHLIREEQEKQLLIVEHKERQKLAISIVEKLSPANFDLDQEAISNNWKKDPNFGCWLLSHDKMKAWLSPRNADARTLWLKGIPGAGEIDTSRP